MTATAAPRLPRSRVRRIRPILIVAASIAIVGGSYVANALRPAAVPPPVGQLAVPDQPALTAPGDAPNGASAGLATIDRALKAWSTNGWESSSART